MQLTGLHLLLTYQCNFECDHCFVWASPRQTGTFTIGQVEEVLHQAREVGTVEWIYFEGGEPFLYYSTLLAAARLAADAGFQVGVVSNGYWAISERDAVECLRPFDGLLGDLSISSDLYHYDEWLSRQARDAHAAAAALRIPAGFIQVAQPDAPDAMPAEGQLPEGSSSVMYRGRAAATLASRAVLRDWETFTECPHEDLREPGRVHLDPFGNLHICQGISIGNLFRTSLREICRAYDPTSHPIIGPLLDGGPAELVRRYGLSLDGSYADACHLCYEARRALRLRFPVVLGPDQMYGCEP
jgi:MoaA/NifB/PqqE/SkfB family radical SAM enzyme